MRFLDASDVRLALPMEAAIEAMREGLGDEREGPPRVLLAGSLFMAGRAGPNTGIKAVSTVPGDPAGLVVVFDGAGRPVGLVDGPTLTAIRTGAAAGLATDLLAPGDADTFAMIGAGAMAPDQIAAVKAVRSIRKIRVWSRDPEKARTLADRVGGEACPTPAATVGGATVVTTATPSLRPLFPAGAVASPCHLNAIGAFTPAMAELPPDLLRRSFVVVDDQDAARAEAGDLLQAGVDADAEIADLLRGRAAAPPGTATVFKSVGIASQDVAAAVAALDRAAALGIGTVL